MSSMTADDPALQHLRSGFGKQVLGKQSTAASWGFGSGHRDGYAKMYLSAEQTKSLAGNNSQGPVYKTYEANGSQCDSKKATAPAYAWGASKGKRGFNYETLAPGPGTYTNPGSIGTMPDSKHSTAVRPVFGSSTRDGESKVFLDEELSKVNFGKNSPGPSAYNLPGGIGKMATSQHTSAPTYKQSTAPRMNEKDWRRNVPAPGHYQPAESFGTQALSTKKTSATLKFGSSHRDHYKKVFISKDHEKASFGQNSPGPAATGSRIDAVGKQASSKNTSLPAYGFGSAKRGTNYETIAPGPGAYIA